MGARQNLTENLKLRIDTALKKDLEALAKKGDRNLTQEIRRGLRAYVEAEKNGAAS